MTPRLALDTNAYTAYVSGDSAIGKLVDYAGHLGLPVIALGELYYGAFNGSRTAENLHNINRFLLSQRLEVLHITEDTARLYGEISAELRKIGRPIQQNDVWIAALCKQYNYALATRDTDFNQIIGLEVINF